MTSRTRQGEPRAPLYAVVFEMDPSSYRNASPILVAPASSTAGVTLPHGLSTEVAKALPALWYCVHLPGFQQQLDDIPAVALKDAQRLFLAPYIVLAPAGARYLVRRRPLLAFFGLGGRHRVIVYPSRLKVERSRGVDDASRSFQAMATPEYEARMIAEITAFFDRFTPRILRWLDAPLLRWGDVKVGGVVKTCGWACHVGR